jgi:hypothetical protein
MRLDSPDRARLKKIIRGSGAGARGGRPDAGRVRLRKHGPDFREAPVLILNFSGSTVMPGGAGNACANVPPLGGRRRAHRSWSGTTRQAQGSWPASEPAA